MHTEGTNEEPRGVQRGDPQPGVKPAPSPVCSREGRSPAHRKWGSGRRAQLGSRALGLGRTQWLSPEPPDSGM